PLPADEGGWASEISIDVQTAHAICPGCHILLVEANSEKFADLGTAVNAAAKLGATVISNSYGGSEEGSDTTLGATYYTHPASVLVASSGDCGYLNEACGLPTPVDFPAASSGVVAVGGTSLSEASGSWSSAAWDEGGSGCSTVFEAGLWQATAANFAASGCKKGRAVADVSAIGDPGTGVNIYDSTPEVAGEKTGWGVWGGTSVSAPIVAAEFALAGGSHGVLHPAATLYSHLGEASTLYDVSSGTNGKCAGATICSATIGYDGPSGVGSPVGLGAFEISGSPKSTAQPTISGTLEQGQTLSESHGGWTGTPTSYSYQWERCGAGGKGCLAIAGATAQSYLLAGADAGLTIRVRETADNAVGSGGEHSAVTAQILSDVPSIASFGPISGITGSKLAIAGSALSTATQLIIGKRSASFVVLSPTTLEATVPDGALAGKVSVTTAHGTATSKGKFKPTFAVDLLKPLAGAAGTTVAIKGVGFNSSSKVSFAGTPAITTFVSGSKLKAIVPAGAGSGHVTVTNTAAPAGTVRSAATFTP
ncbi:MAG TPA: IPT/TIG domain-containing protein, partial [Solirubrobacteraceae bacterium]